ncbi:Dipeptidyl aminopeptidase/acylaminoacyl peptidase [Williamsia sterculiae]|uniref:Dipeptidyl aminopeptidase/acylaminoacyl peptidase n=1 Tax=Williamsia sterculiae TaxID=1344003 RepID=A0A1N7GR20_9NOCA|nr:Dipeptidyl aminopeptidase/acylaminoacyl peptidase [Williamsia sterculiae]
MTGAAAGRASVDLAAAAADGDARSGDAPPTWRSYGSSVSPDNSAFAYIVDDGTGYPRAAQRSLSRKTGVGPMRWVRIPAAGPARTVVHSANGRWLAVEIAPSGGEHHQVWAVTTDAEDDTAYRIAAVQADGTAYATVELVGWDANLVLITATESDGTAHALQVNPKTGATIDLDARVGGHLVDSWKGAALLRVGPRGYRDMLLARRGRVTQLLPNDPGATTDAGAILDQGFAHPSRVFTRPPHLQQLRDLDSVQALVRSDFDAKYARLLGVEVSSGGVRFQVLAERTHCDLEEFAVSNDQSTVALLWNNHGRSELEILSLPDQTNLGPIELPGAVASELSISAAGSLITLTVQSPDSPPRVHLVQTRLGRVTPVDDEAVPTDARPEPIQVEFSARDGMPLSGWLHRPTANPEGPAPTFLYFHGGPEAQARPEYNFFVNGLVAAGYTVFAANVRGSGGFGRLFGHADDRYGRYAGIDDAADCVDFLVDEAVADPDRVFCAGRSYGGYLTLACLTFHPTLFAGGVAICGMSDLEAFYRNTEPWIAVAAYTKYGHPDTDRELLRDLSPIHRIDRIVAPLLVIHGAHDTNVPVSESQRMVEQVVAQGGRAELLMFPDEGHEIVRWENQQTMIRRAVAWSDAIARTEDRP